MAGGSANRHTIRPHMNIRQVFDLSVFSFNTHSHTNEQVNNQLGQTSDYNPGCDKSARTNKARYCSAGHIAVRTVVYVKRPADRSAVTRLLRAVVKWQQPLNACDQKARAGVSLRADDGRRLGRFVNSDPPTLRFIRAVSLDGACNLGLVSWAKTTAACHVPN